MVSVTRRLARWVTALARRIGLDANPLRRGSDRAEAWVRMTLIAVFLVASPLAAIGLGQLTASSSASAARAQAASERQVTAVLLDRSPRPPADSLYGSAEFVYTRARWAAPDGQQRNGEVPAPVGSPAGRHITIWVDTAGRLAFPPIGAGQIASRVVAVVALTPALLGILLLLAMWVVRRVLDRRRLTGWAAEWSAVEPQWTKRTP
jgi:hypothetical protein